MKEQVELWKQAFEDDEHAVLPTLVQFAWNYAAFSSVVELVRAAPENERGGKQMNSMLLELLTSTYWGSAVMAIRRLVDRGSISGERGVYSLRSIINDAQGHRERLTRRVYIEVIARQPYDYEQVEQRYWQYVLGQVPGPVHVPPELHFELSQRRHEEFDWLSGVSQNNRSEDDLIQTEVFDRLKDRLARLDTIAEHGTIYFAHASTTESRAGRGLQNWNLHEAKEALRDLANVAEFVGRWFCGSGIGDILPTPQFDQFEFLDRPLIDGPTHVLQDRWDEFRDEVSSWPYIENTDL